MSKLTKVLSLLALTMVSLSVSASTVTWRNLRLSIVTEMPEGYTVSYQFSKCMANDLFTFSQVLIDDVIVNSATSDNIGPFLLSGGWTGGNHLMPDNTTHSAETTSIQVVVDGDTLNANANLNAKKVVINVSNNIYNPNNRAELFCIEKIKYTVVGNSIQVEAQHTFCNLTPMVVSRYYGMQSMAIDETAILTPEGAYKTWTPIGSVDRFTKISAPRFHQFIEKMPTCYQASYMLPEGLGTRYLVQDNDVVFIGNSYGKSYHKLMGNATVTNGQNITWKGIYTWFKTPIIDKADGTFSYKGYKDGNEVIFNSSPSNEDVIEENVSGINEMTEDKDECIIATASNGRINVSEGVKYVKCYSINGQFVAQGSGSLSVPPGFYILKDDNDRILKLCVN